MNIPATFIAYFLCFAIFGVAPALAYFYGLERGRKEFDIKTDIIWYAAVKDTCEVVYELYGDDFFNVHDHEELYSDVLVAYDWGEVNIKMASKLLYVYNGHYVQHVGDRESCERYIRNAKELFGVTDLTICMEVNGRYRPALKVKWTLNPALPSEAGFFVKAPINVKIGRVFNVNPLKLNTRRL